MPPVNSNNTEMFYRNLQMSKCVQLICIPSTRKEAYLDMSLDTKVSEIIPSNLIPRCWGYLLGLPNFHPGVLSVGMGVSAWRRFEGHGADGAFIEDLTMRALNMRLQRSYIRKDDTTMNTTECTYKQTNPDRDGEGESERKNTYYLKH